MADPLGLSLASASIASAQVVSSLRTISSAYFKFMVSTDANSKQDIHNYEITLRRLDTLLRVLESESSSQIPMHLLEESYRELRIQMALLESLANEASKSKSKFVVKLRWTIREKRRLEHFAARLDHFIKLFEASLSLHRLQSIKMLSDLEAISHASEKPVSKVDSSLGVRILHSPQDGNIGLDIIFIHGLQARSLATWGGVDKYWPRDLLPKVLPNTRILTYDYDFGPSLLVKKGRILIEAKALIADIESLSQDIQRCPLIFCAHSFGGLLLKSAMTYCHRAKSFDESCEGILSRTRGALFLGVPSPLGSSTSWFGEYIGKIHRSGYGVDQSTSISLADRFSVEFGEMFRTDYEIFRELSQSRGWSTFTFYESKETMTRYGPILITGLSEHSSDENIGVLPGDHYTMCRFQTPDDVGFLAVSRRLKLISSGEKDESIDPKPEDLKRGKSVISDILNASQNYSKCLDLFLKELRDNLGSQNFLPAGLEQSAVWINDDDIFQQWARGDVRVLKICGAPGTGKTYLVKHIVSQLTAKHSFKGGQRGDRDVLVHFVDWKSTDRHAPTIVLRSFLFQLLKLHPELFKQIYNRIHYPINVFEDLDMLLFDLLSNSRLKGLDIVIHGVDNMDRNSRDLVGGTLSRFISAETGMPDTKVLLTCRKGNVFSDEIEAQHHPTVLDLEQVALEGKRDSEVKAYVNSCVVALRNNHKLPNILVDMIRTDLIARTVAQRKGVNLQSKVSPVNINTEPKTRLNNFLWISLVVDLVSSEERPSKVRSLLESAEFELVDLFSVYERIIARVPPNYDIVRILRFLQSARRPISLEELAFAIAIRSDHETAAAVEEDRYLSLRGILEAFASALVIFQDDSVSLIHPSLSEYLEKLNEDAISRGHNEFAEACLRSLLLGTKKSYAERLLLTDDRLNRHLSPLSFSATPFLRYASEFWFKHVRMALCVNNVGPLLALTVDFLTSDRWESWLTFFRQSTGRDQLPTDRSPIHTFAALNLLNRLEILERLEPGICSRDASKWTPLHYAAANSASESIDFILSQDDLSDIADPELLHLAVTKGNTTLLKWLLKHMKVPITHSLFMSAIDGRHWSAFELLDRHHKESKSLSSKQWNWHSWSDKNGGALHHAVRSRNLKIIKTFLTAGADQLKRFKGKTALHQAAQIGDEKIVGLLLLSQETKDSPVDHSRNFVDIPDELDGNTPLHLATEIGSLKVVQLLVDHNADVNSENKRKQTALHLAARFGHEEILSFLLALGAAVNCRDNQNLTPLHMASAGCWTTVVKRLLGQGADIFAQAEEGRTPLHLAAANGSYDTAKVLLEAGANPVARDENGSTPLHVTAQNGSIDLVMMLLEQEASPSLRDLEGKTPLHHAVTSQAASAKVVQLLLEAEANAEVNDESGKTALDYAKGEENTLIAALLEPYTTTLHP